MESVMADRSGQHLTNMMVVWAAVAVASLAAYVVCELRSAGRL